jgi:hypothetical protein
MGTLMSVLLTDASAGILSTPIVSYPLLEQVVSAGEDPETCKKGDQLPGR